MQNSRLDFFSFRTLKVFLSCFQALHLFWWKVCCNFYLCSFVIFPWLPSRFYFRLCVLVWVISIYLSIIKLTVISSHVCVHQPVDKLLEDVLKISNIMCFISSISVSLFLKVVFLLLTFPLKMFIIFLIIFSPENVFFPFNFSVSCTL